MQGSLPSICRVNKHPVAAHLYHPLQVLLSILHSYIIGIEQKTNWYMCLACSAADDCMDCGQSPEQDAVSVYVQQLEEYRKRCELTGQ